MNYYRKKGRRLKFNYFEITRRELLTSISIIAIMLLIGIMISAKISENQMDKNEIYNKSIKINNQDLFQYGMDTNVGNAFVYGNLIAVDTVTYPEIGGEYMSIEKVKERYTKHTRTVQKTRKKANGETETYTEKEEYWTWDMVDSWSQYCKKVTFLGIEFDYGEIYKPQKSYIDTKKESSHIRYVYYGSPTKYTGTMFSFLKNKTINDAKFYNGMNIDETVSYLESSVRIVIFWIFWIILICGCVFGFYYLDNKWLEN